jgi:hypothetical protein
MCPRQVRRYAAIYVSSALGGAPDDVTPPLLMTCVTAVTTRHLLPHSLCPHAVTRPHAERSLCPHAVTHADALTQPLSACDAVTRQHADNVGQRLGYQVEGGCREWA